MVQGIYWRTKSLIDGAPIVVVVTAQSKNTKTGDMAQSWILREDIDPLTTSREGKDVSVCGNCVRRHSLGGDCYVVIYRAPLQIWRSYKEGSYREFDSTIPCEFVGKPFRFGAYGDPAAVPIGEWHRYLQWQRPVTTLGYTHRWREYPEGRHLLMASVDTLAEYRAARETGWRTFRVVQSIDELTPQEFSCPASEEQGKRLQCIDCKACYGIRPYQSPYRVASPAIIAHGIRSTR